MEAHPEISSIIRKRDEIHNQIYTHRQYDKAIYGILGLLNELKPEDKDKELTEKIQREMATVTVMQATQRTQYLKKNWIKYTQYLEKLNNILWNKDYLINEKYGGFYDPSNKKRSGESLKKFGGTKQ